MSAIGVRVVVARRQAAFDARRLAVEHPRADVDRGVVEEDADFGALGGGPAFVGVALREAVGDGRLRPGLVGEPAVDDRRRAGADGANDAGRRPVGRLP